MNFILLNNPMYNFILKSCHIKKDADNYSFHFGRNVYNNL